MKIPIKCPECGKLFTIDVPAIEKYKRRVAELEKQLRENSEVNKLKRIFGMED